MGEQVFLGTNIEHNTFERNAVSNNKISNKSLMCVTMQFYHVAVQDILKIFFSNHKC